ncbi:hypothetical protein T02_7493 [Trichinella nativa]|uniref:Uncharacterized protein n=1 Tax=Trichinella nativa TaxID=6335 RepID=A0A0V1KKK0_9BILA|nr:hypothetical protein T02_7493 [Trichinella nativa]
MENKCETNFKTLEESLQKGLRETCWKNIMKKEM